MNKISHYPSWKALAEIIREQDEFTPGKFYSDSEIATILDEKNWRYCWMKCCLELSRRYGMDFIRVKKPIKGYRVMTNDEKVNVSFDRRMKKTRRNFNRMARVAVSVDRNSLSENDARAQDMNLAQLGILGSAFVKLPSNARLVRMEIELDRELPKIK